ncbi:CocE/NonD family hydrolase [Paracoccus hibiscisoli]|uniref:CocE/NonD family hydrolase n=1 Tax=Paracoccus hibiscisoli TaxID=2023261 RepID=UPI00391A99AA
MTPARSSGRWPRTSAPPSKARQRTQIMQMQMVVMRDGVRLATDIHMPDGPGPWPVILERTPYDRQGVSGSEVALDRPDPLTRAELGRIMARRGYAVVMQDVRGRYGSEGVFQKYVNEAEDGVDTHHWLLAQPWCDGRICTMGLSYGAHTQLASAVAGAPGIAAMAIDTGGLMDAWRHSVRYGGAFEQKQVTWAFRHAAKALRERGRTADAAMVEGTDIRTALLQGDWRPGHSPLALAPDYEAMLLRLWAMGPDDPALNLPATKAVAHFDRFPDVPVLLVGSWNDPYARNMLDLAQAIGARSTAPLRQIFGPWLHGRRSTGLVGQADFGDGATIDRATGRDWVTLRLDWFDHAMGRGGMPLDHDLFWQMSAGRWPAMGGQWSRRRDGSDADCALGVDDVTLRFDPAHPHPTPGGAVTSGGAIMSGGMFDQRRLGTLDHPGSATVFAAPLAADLPLSDGAVTAICEAPGRFDLHAVVVEALPCGAVINITDGIARASGPGAVTVDLAPTFYRARRGNRLGLILAASSFPRFDCAMRHAGDVRVRNATLCLNPRRG